jgi:hypothetical protein
MANVIECPVWAGTGAEDAGGWPCSDCEGRGMIPTLVQRMWSEKG